MSRSDPSWPRYNDRMSGPAKEHSYGMYFLASLIVKSITQAIVRSYVPHSFLELTFVMILAGIADLAPLYFLAHWFVDLIRRRGNIDRPENTIARGVINVVFALISFVVILAILVQATSAAARP